MHPSFPLLLFALLPSAALAGPFGIDLATFDPRAAGCTAIADNYYTCAVPAPQPEFETYVVYYVHKVGVCLIKGVSANIVDMPTGMKTRATTNLAAGKLVGTYGPWTDLTDAMAEADVPGDPAAWMQDLTDGKRLYIYYWALPEPKDGIAEVYVSAQATNAMVGYYSVEYYTPAYDDCDKASAP